MNKLRLYHGSEFIINNPVFGKGSPKNDYGQGFYCTRDIEKAKEWAAQKGNQGYCNVYEIDTTNLNFLYLNNSKYSILHWMTLLLQNRTQKIHNEALDFLYKHFSLDISKYDIIVGYRADDSYFKYAKDFLLDAITIESLSKAMKLGNLGIQTVIKSEKAFNRIEFIEAQPVQTQIYYENFFNNETAAKECHDTKIRKAPKSTGTLITDVIRNPKLLEQKLQIKIPETLRGI